MWAERVHDWVEREQGGPVLVTAFVRAVRRVSARYPDCWFELGQRTDEAVEGLAHRAFTVCDRVPKGRFPFLQRTPFQTFVAEAHDDRTIGWHAFYAKLSITRELMRDDYARNVRKDPVLRWRDALYREVGEVLARVAVRSGEGWTVEVAGPRPVRSTEAVVERLRGGAGGVEALVPEALRLLGAPIRQGPLANLLVQVIPAPTADVAWPEPEARDPSAVAVREAVLVAWEGLEPPARALLAALVRDEDYDTMILRDPSLKSRSGVSRAMQRVSQDFVVSVAAAVGWETDGASVTPRTLLEHVLDVLLPLIEQEDGHG